MPVRKTSEATGQHFRLVLLSPSGEAEESATAGTGRRRVKGQCVRLDVGTACGICGLYLPAEFSALRGVSLKVVLHCFMIGSSPPAGNWGSLFKLSFPRRLFRMDCKGSRWHLNTAQHSNDLNRAEIDLKTTHKIKNIFVELP